MNFQAYVDPMKNEVDPKKIVYTDDAGAVWIVPEGHRFWDLYQSWLAEGNKI